MNKNSIMKGHTNFEKPPYLHSGSRPRLETRKTVNISGFTALSGMGNSISGDFQVGYKVSKTEEGELPNFKRPKLTEKCDLSEAGPPDQCQKQIISPCDGSDCMVPLRQVDMFQRVRTGLMATTGQSSVMASQFNPLDEPSPLGLSLRKSPSLLDLIQSKLMQCEDEGSQFEDFENPGLKTSRSGRGVPVLGTEKDKLKAANFPALTLRIGTWEYTSRYDGDLVAKCYYAKRKLVWEILDRGLKSKMEIQWSDISGLKATFSEDHSATLDLEVSRPPLFFREINPQPRKHTLWQSTSDFTDEQATMCRHHSVQFPEGVLNRHFEKLLQCDLRLKTLNEQTRAINDSLFFDNRNMHIDGQLRYQSVLSEHAAIHPSIIEGFRDEPFKHRAPARDVFYSHQTIEGFKDPSKRAAPVNSDLMYITPVAEVLQPQRSLEIQSSDVASPSSVIDTRGLDETSSCSETEETHPKEEVPGQAYDEQMHSSVSSVNTSSFSTFIAGSARQMEECLSSLHPEISMKWKNGGVPSSSIHASEKQVLNELSLHLLGEPISSAHRLACTLEPAKATALSPACIREGCELLTNISSALQTGTPSPVDACRDQVHPTSKYSGSHHGLLGNGDTKVHSKFEGNYWSPSLENRSSSLETGTSSFTSHGSCSDLLYLPRIASLPQFFEPAL